MKINKTLQIKSPGKKKTLVSGKFNILLMIESFQFVLLVLLLLFLLLYYNNPFSYPGRFQSRAVLSPVRSLGHGPSFPMSDRLKLPSTAPTYRAVPGLHPCLSQVDSDRIWVALALAKCLCSSVAIALGCCKTHIYVPYLIVWKSASPCSYEWKARSKHLHLLSKIQFHPKETVFTWHGDDCNFQLRACWTANLATAQCFCPREAVVTKRELVVFCRRSPQPLKATTRANQCLS